MMTLHDLASIVADRLDVSKEEAADVLQGIEMRAAYAARAVVELPPFISLETLLHEAMLEGMMT